MSDFDSPAPTLVARWETLALSDTAAGAPDAGSTIAARRPLETFQRQQALGALPLIHTGSDNDEKADFLPGEPLGQGGMGVVHQAHQRSLWRDVAIKTIRPDRRNSESTRGLLKEAWVTGMLEHPNIIPVHALGVDASGAPMLVMKRVEGLAWFDTLQSPELLPRRFAGYREPLDAHLEILMQVCDAVHFAHSRGVIHRDLKPENVMLGDYGEVYLVDWGIAVSLVDDGTDRIQLARDVDEVAGTPSYMAPEMARGEGASIDQRSDVYQLGAILHELITHTPRNAGDSVMAALINAYQATPVIYGPDVPEELATICNTATARLPEDRFQSAEDLRLALASYQHHRDSRRLADEARVRLITLEAHLHEWSGDASQTQQPLAATDRSEDNDATARIYRLYAECRFAFEQALTVWPDNLQAREGLDRAIEHMLDFELKQGDEKAAALLLDEIRGDRSAFEERLRALRLRLHDEARELQKLKKLSYDVDIDLNSAARSRMSFLLGVVLGIIPLINSGLVHLGLATMTFPEYFLQYVGVIGGAGLIVFLMRKRLLSNAINTRIIISIFVILFGSLIMRVMGFILGLDVAGCIALENGLFAFALMMMATSLDARLWPASIAFLAGAIGGGLLPHWMLEFDGASNAAALWIIAWVWRVPRQRSLSGQRGES
ncbi:serine/threonine protein kinase [Lujinxingia sediminis]|uniref:Serine/threonine protein kinase n=1 Tax=Lujinxingia sediminis TaxID=2480984 RepID=A0ABY0CPC9_9DELT|nr:serine/threonine-protein kinase [Lujinxingia sediminis]RVU41404.1 serine/threonine protein kinase [Lujinxingia sediminis]